MEKIIFIIDDDPSELNIFNEALKKVPGEFDCKQAKDAKQVISLLNKYLPDFIFIDFELNGQTGLDYLAQLKKLEELSNTRFIMYAHQLDKNLAVKAEAMGAYCIKKPYLLSTLTQFLRKILTEK